MSDYKTSFSPNAESIRNAQKAAADAKAALPRKPPAAKPPSPTGGVTEENNPGSLAPPDLSAKALEEGADTDAMFAEVRRKSAQLRDVNAGKGSDAVAAAALAGAGAIPAIAASLPSSAT